MNARHKAIRALLSTMAPKRAIAYIQAFELPEDEELVLIQCDVRRRSVCQVAFALNRSPDSIKQYRRRAYAKIADQIDHP